METKQWNTPNNFVLQIFESFHTEPTYVHPSYLSKLKINFKITANEMATQSEIMLKRNVKLLFDLYCSLHTNVVCCLMHTVHVLNAINT